MVAHEKIVIECLTGCTVERVLADFRTYVTCWEQESVVTWR
jgi:hypothetical protein